MASTTPQPGSRVRVGPLPLAEERLGEPVYYRLWCSAEGLPPNEYRSVEFCGWLIGWGASALARPLEAFRLGSRGVATHAEVELFLADDGQIVSAVELLPDAAWEFASSPPDRWATFLGRHADLGQATEWLRRVEQLHGAGARWVAVSDALSQAHETLVSAR